MDAKLIPSLKKNKFPSFQCSQGKDGNFKKWHFCLIFVWFFFFFFFLNSSILHEDRLTPTAQCFRMWPSLFGNTIFIHIQTKTEVIIVYLNPIWPMSTIFLKGHLDLETDTDGGQDEDTWGVWHVRQEMGSQVCKDRQGLLAARRSWKTQKQPLLSISLWPCRNLEFTLLVSSTACQ